jgi:N6-L-threonylcarbamoyladenine synthase
MQNAHTILAVESSCDETAASVIVNGIIQSNIINSQIETHAQYGGVIPELAAAGHLQAIRQVVEVALQQAHLTLSDIDAFAATSKPGLPGSLLVGLNFTKSLAAMTSKPLIGVDHLEGHIYSACIENNVAFPFLCLTASGGHTALYKVNNYRSYEKIGYTLDDAAGEAFDKVAKLLNLPYPGGPIIENLAASVEYHDYYNYPRGKKDTYNFSFSGIKTAVLYHLLQLGAYDQQEKRFISNDELLKAEVASSLLCAVSDMMQQRIMRALQEHQDIKSVCFVGGVACNRYIKNKLERACANKGIAFYTPSKLYCTDNAGMIAFVAHHKALVHQFDSYDLDVL